MKRLAAILALLAVTACGGGGGGGGGNTAPQTSFFDYTSTTTALSAGTGATVSGWSSITSVPVEGVLGSNAELTMEKTASGVVLTVHDGGAFDRSITAGTTNWKLDGNYITGYSSTTEYSQSISSAGKSFYGTITYYNKLYFGGVRAGLSYAEFGVWKQNIRLSGTVDGQPYNQTVRYVDAPFYHIADGSASSAVTGPGPVTFSGNAIGTAWEYSGLSWRDIDITGTAALTVNTASPGNASLLLQFPGFYDFTFSGVNTSATSATVLGQSMTAMANGANTTGISLGAGDGLKGDMEIFYAGPSATDTREAVGGFDIYNASETKGVFGAFGVKKP